jgi:hypothetical protein
VPLVLDVSSPVALRPPVERLQNLTKNQIASPPNRPPPRWFDARELVMVAACAAAIGGSGTAGRHHRRVRGLEERAAHGQLCLGEAHFFDHGDRGRRRRLADEREARMRARQNVRPPPVALLPFAGIPRAHMDADLERVFGAGRRVRTP